jgi:hypothetical protein
MFPCRFLLQFPIVAILAAMGLLLVVVEHNRNVATVPAAATTAPDSAGWFCPFTPLETARVTGIYGKHGIYDDRDQLVSYCADYPCTVADGHACCAITVATSNGCCFATGVEPYWRRSRIAYRLGEKVLFRRGTCNPAALQFDGVWVCNVAEVFFC